MKFKTKKCNRICTLVRQYNNTPNQECISDTLPTQFIVSNDQIDFYNPPRTLGKTLQKQPMYF